MYRWRQLNEQQRAELLSFRRQSGRPWHSPPHRISEGGRYLLTAACFEHQAILGSTRERMAGFADQWLELLRTQTEEINAWCVLPNHYHALIRTERLPELLHKLGRLHGRTAFDWNGEDSRRGRKVWFNCAETALKSERHFWATLNYVHHNPVHHGYVEHWQDWPFSSAAEYLKARGRAAAASTWREFPVLDFGKDWDRPEW